jgi:hypothetical protein
MPTVDIVEFNGVTYRRYPESTKLELRNYYTPNGTQLKAGRRRLHQEVWIYHNGQSQKTITCTIRTKTLLTTTSPTLNACPDPNICPSICKAKSAKKLQDSTWGQHELRPLLGTGQKQVSLGIAKTENSHGPTEKIPKQHASTVALSTLKSFPENIVQTNANPRLVALPELTTKTETAQSVAQDSESTDTPRLAPAGVSVVSVDSAESSLVYNLQVEDCPEYFANGVLVHNCRYACMHRGHGAFTTKTTGQY